MVGSHAFFVLDPYQGREARGCRLCLPCDAQELLKVGLDEMLRTIREKEPLRPSTRLTAIAAADVRRLTSKSVIRNPQSAMDGASGEHFLCLDEVAEPAHVDFVIERIARVARADDGERIQAQHLKGGTLGRCHLGRVRVFDLEAEPFPAVK